MLISFPAPLVAGTLLRRYKRFLADIQLESGETVTAHCCNPGAMLGLDAAGSRVWLSRSDNPARKLAYSWELIEIDLGGGPQLVGINTSYPNKAVEAAIAAGLVPGLAGYDSCRREVRYGGNSRIDFLLEGEQRSPCYVEVKNVHLMRRRGLAEFPDSVTARGAKHLAELAAMAQGGARAVMLFVIQRDDAQDLALAEDIDPAYAKGFGLALAAGVEVMVMVCAPSLTGLQMPRFLPAVVGKKAPGRRADIAQIEISP